MGWVSEGVWEAEGKTYENVNGQWEVQGNAPVQPEQPQGSLVPDAPAQEAQPASQSTVPAVETVQDGLDSKAPSGTDIAKGVGTEIALATAGQLAAAATGPGYIPLAFASGFAASIAGQEVEGREDYSYGRALMGGLINLIPGGKKLFALKDAAKAAGRTLTAKELAIAGAKIEAKRGAAFGIGEATAVATIDEHRLPTPEEMLKYGTLGAAFGGLLGAATPAVGKSLRKMFGKTVDEIDDGIRTGDITPEDTANVESLFKDQGIQGALSGRKKNVSPKPTATKLGKGIQGALKSTESSPSPSTTATTSGKGVQSAMSGAEESVQKERFINNVISASEQKQVRKTIAQADSGPDFLQRVYRYFRPSKITGRRAQEYSLKARQAIEADAAQASRSANRISAYTAGNKGRGELVDETYRTGKIQEQLLGTEIEDDLERFLLARKNYVKRLIIDVDANQLGNYTPDEQMYLSKKLNESLATGNYVTREYRMFTDTTFKPNLKMKAMAQREIAEQLAVEKGISLNEANELALAHIKKLESKSAFARTSNPNRAGAEAVDGILRQKKDPGPAERAWLGEITDPGERLRGTWTKMSKLVHTAEKDIAIVNALKGNGLAVSEDLPGYVPLVLGGKTQTGLFVPREVELALAKSVFSGQDQHLQDSVQATFADAYNTAIGLSKASKVLLNPPSYAVNALGGIMTMLGQGINPFSSNYKRGVHLALAQFGGYEKLVSKSGGDAVRALRDDMNDMAKYGLGNANVLESDIRDSLKRGLFSGYVGKKLEGIGKAYSVTDNAARWATWKHNQNMFRKIYPYLDDEQIKQAAAEFTNDVFQNFNKVSPIIKSASRIGIMPQFVAFTAEFSRNIYNQAKYAGMMAKGTFGTHFGLNPSEANLKAMRVEGVKRLTALGVMVATAEAGRRAVNAGQGVTAEKEAALKKAGLPDWAQNQSLAFKMNPDGKSGSYVNTSYLVPHAMAAEAIKAAVSGSPIDNLQGVLIGQLVGEGNFVSASLYRAIENRDAYGREISDATTPMDKLADKLSFVLKDAFEPGIVREADKVYNTVYAPEGEKDYTIGELAARQIGARFNTFDIAESAGYKIADSKGAADRAFSSYNTERERGVLSPEGVERLYQETNNKRKEHMQQIAEVDKSMQTLGFSEEERIKALKKGRLASPDVLATIEGKYNEMKRNPKLSIADTYDANFGGLDDDDIQTKINTMPPESRAEQLAMRREFKKRKKAERIGLTTKDSLLKGLSVQERADYIQEHPESFDELRSKGVITPSVMLELRLRENR